MAGRRGLASLTRARRGAAGIEFALIGPLFLILMFATLEMGLDLFTQSALDDSVRSTARQMQIRAVTTAAQVQAGICAELGLVVANCPASIQIYVASGPLFAALPLATVGANGTLTPATFTPGAASSDVLMQVAYTRSFVMPYFGGLIGGNFNNTLVSTFAFQNEPF